ncbi:GntR family transcriptional regulator [Staphylococcus warneri]|uniref:GntR family transcriptional regulator n=1 Tax=Staphylococcus warneri TaxID=1292 RepID=UPI000736EA40|nr:GntR family transcriptional regulator [Staphylococcus warneri]AXZ22451.1 GntR family transcriptional regulator [Staphylococcus warneri]KTW06670.1 GntR family transcriptional regulator [Staphylococcus warneri]OIS42196.1 GntR family transcriptional regulator [Staphylococcus warneri]OIS45616.1 GntR family transcriptional regulator [Staphylococcus warneri]PTI08640.1 GntR family transcriptional regulator [Staphylococcus warneri]
MLKYEHIANDIEWFIDNGHYQAGDKLPSVEELKVKYNVSKSTIIKSLAILEKEGTIFQARGSGIYVRNKKIDGYVNLLKTKGFSDNLQDHNISSLVIEFDEFIPEEAVRTHLKLNKNEKVIFIKRLRFLDNQILCIETSYFNKNIVPTLDKKIATQSIFSHIQKQLNINIGFSDIYFYVDFLNKNESQLLELNEGDPCMRHELIFHTNKGMPFDYSNIVYHFKNAKFFVPIQS